MKYLYIKLSILLFCSSYIYCQELALVKENDLYGYIDISGKYVIKPQYKDAQDFSGKYAAVRIERKWGFIDTEGTLVIAPQFENVKGFNSGFALVEKNGEWIHIDHNNVQLKTTEGHRFYPFNDGIAIFKYRGDAGLINTNGEVILEPIYEQIYDFRDGYAKIIHDDNFGMIDKTGKVFIPAIYEELGNYSKNGVWGLLKRDYGVFNNGQFHAVEGMKQVWDFSTDIELSIARKKGKIGFVDNKGHWKIKPIYRNARPFKNGLAAVSNGRHWGFINEKGDLVIDFKFWEAREFSDNGLAAVKLSRWGFIDRSGKFVIEPKYSLIKSNEGSKSFPHEGFNDDIVLVKFEDGWGYLNEKGQLLGDKWYEDAGLFKNNE